MVDSACYSIETPRLVVRRLTQFDVSERYVSWLNDNEITKHLEIREQLHTKDSCIEFVSSCLEDENTFLFGLFIKHENGSEGVHIGNVKLGPIQRRHGIAEISYFIGDQSYHGKGFGVEGVSAVLEFGFGAQSLFKIRAGAYASNTASIKLLARCRFKHEVTLANEVVNARGEREDLLRFVLMPDGYHV